MVPLGPVTMLPQVLELPVVVSVATVVVYGVIASVVVDVGVVVGGVVVSVIVSGYSVVVVDGVGDVAV